MAGCAAVIWTTRVGTVARVIELHHDLVFAELDRAQLVEYREDGRGIWIADSIIGERRLSGAALRRDRPARHGPHRRAEPRARRRPMTLEALGRRQRARPAIRGIERMNLAVLRRDVHDADLLAPTAAIGVGAHDDGRAGRQRVSIEPVDERLCDPDAFAFYQRRLAVRAFRRDDEVHVRVHPVEARDRAFDDDLLASCRTWTGCGAPKRDAQEGGRGENRRGGCQAFHGVNLGGTDSLTCGSVGASIAQNQ